MNVWSTVDRFLQMQAGVVGTPHPMSMDLLRKVGTVLDNHSSVVMLKEKIQKVNSDYALAISETDKVNTKRTLELHKEFVEYLIASHGTDQMVIRSPWTKISQIPGDENKYQMVYESAGTVPVSVDVVEIAGKHGSFRFASPTLSNAEIKKYAQFMVRTVLNNFMFRVTTIEDKIDQARATEPLWKSNDKLLQMWIDNVRLEDNGENGVNMHFDSTFVSALTELVKDVDTILNLINLLDTMPKDT